MTAVEASFTLSVGDAASPFTLTAELNLEEGIMVLFGPSGSGKSLTLQALVGLIRPQRGRIRVHNDTVFDSETGSWVAPHRRRIGYVPQHHALFPFCDVLSNIVFGLPRAERKVPSKRIEGLIDELGLRALRSAMPTNLSGGERQRVALARALAVKPRLLVLDEPFASIDAPGRAELRNVVCETISRHSIPAVFVTHDPIEAFQLGARVVRFERGRTVAEGPVSELLATARERLLRSLGVPPEDDTSAEPE